MSEPAIPYGRHSISEADIDAVVAVLRSDWLTQGTKVPEFEHAIANYVGARYAVAVCNGTAALHIACLAAGIGKGDTVVTSPNTFVASANCALYVDAVPKFSDIDADTLNMDPEQLARRCRELTGVKAIIPVHFAGLPCDMPRIRKIADERGAVVIEDAAHAFGAKYADGSRVGNCRYSGMTIFSFHPAKMLTTGEGGLITTNSERLYRRLLRLRSHGINKLDDRLLNDGNAYTDGEANVWYHEMQEIGFNYRMTDIQAALGLSQLERLEKFLQRRKSLAKRYDELWNQNPNIRPAQPVASRDQSSLHLYVVRIRFDQLGISRNKFMKALRGVGITTQLHYLPVHFHPYHAQFGHGGLPVVEKYYREGLSIPLYYGLSDEEQAFVVNSIQQLLV